MKFLFVWVLLWPAASFAHGNHGAGLDGLFSELAKNGLLLHTRPAGSGSYVRLANGQRYNLDSKFWASAASFLDSDSPAEPRGTIKQRVIAHLKELSHRSFWVSLGADGSEAFLRYGAFTFALIVSAEFVEHTFIPGPPLCLAVQAGCLLFTQQIREVWSGARYKQAGEGRLRSRLQTTIQILRGKYDFWRGMRTVLAERPVISGTTKRSYKKSFRRHTPVEEALFNSPFWGSLLQPRADETDPTWALFGGCEHDNLFVGRGGTSAPFSCAAVEDETSEVDQVFYKPLSSATSIAERVVAAQEQLAYLELTLSVAKGAANALLGKPLTYMKLRFHLARTGRLLDNYGFVLRRIAAGSDITDRERVFVEKFVRGYTAYFRDLESHVKSLKEEDTPTVSAASLKMQVAELNGAVKQFRNAGKCAQDLTGFPAAIY